MRKKRRKKEKVVVKLRKICVKRLDRNDKRRKVRNEKM